MSTVQALPRVCPRCSRQLARNHDELVCFVHGQAYEPVRAWETVPDDVAPANAPTKRGTARLRRRGGVVPEVPWTEEERDLWRRAEAGEHFPPPVAEEREPMNETSPTPIRTADDLATPALARLRELVGQIEKAERLAANARAEAARFIVVLDYLRTDVPEQLRGIARSPRPTTSAAASVPESERWTCACGWKSKGRFPGGHTLRCPARKAPAATEGGRHD